MGDKIDEAKQIAERIENANKETLALVERLEKLKVQEILGGQSEAGHIPATISEAEVKKKGASEFFKGSEIERAIKKHG